MERIAYFIRECQGFGRQGYRPYFFEELNAIRGFLTILLTELFGDPDYLSPKVKVFYRKRGFWGRKRYFTKVLSSQNPLLVRAFFGSGGIKMLPICKELGLPLITSFHGSDVTSEARENKYLRRLKVLFKEGDLFIVRSEDMKKDSTALGCPDEKIVVLYGGVDVEKFRKREKRWKEKKGETIILMCGRFVEKKGFQYGIDAFAKVLESHKDLRLWIVGFSKNRALGRNLKKRIKSLNISSKVVLHGFVPYQELPEIYSQADIFLSPNVTSKTGNKEVIPNTIKEAMACELPVVSTRHGGIPELVDDGRSGFLVGERDVEALSQALKYLIEDPGLRFKFGAWGRKIVEERFNLSTQVKKLEKIYAGFLK
jgi:glycosyltransferase involved in cell wall biosynthesis